MEGRSLRGQDGCPCRRNDLYDLKRDHTCRAIAAKPTHWTTLGIFRFRPWLPMPACRARALARKLTAISLQLPQSLWRSRSSDPLDHRRVHIQPDGENDDLEKRRHASSDRTGFCVLDCSLKFCSQHRRDSLPLRQRLLQLGLGRARLLSARAALHARTRPKMAREAATSMQEL
jgi:hypothetical protein